MDAANIDRNEDCDNNDDVDGGDVCGDVGDVRDGGDAHKDNNRDGKHRYNLQPSPQTSK